MRNWKLLVPAAAAVVALGAAGAASASVAAPAGVTGHNYSTFLAGDEVTGNGLNLVAGTWRGLALPVEPAIPALADTVAEGLDLSQFVSGGWQTAEAMVWNDTVHGGACPGMWTLEYNPSLFNTGTVTPMPVPVADLVPVNPGSTAYPFCVPGGGSVFLFLYHSYAHEVTIYSAGDSSTDWDPLAVAHQTVFFHTDASGVSTTNGAAAAALTTGDVLANSPVGTFFSTTTPLVFGKGVNLTQQNFRVFEGTVTGGPPSVANPLTLSFNGLNGKYGAYSITAP